MKKSAVSHFFVSISLSNNEISGKKHFSNDHLRYGEAGMVLQATSQNSLFRTSNEREQKKETVIIQMKIGYDDLAHLACYPPIIP